MTINVFNQLVKLDDKHKNTSGQMASPLLNTPVVSAEFLPSLPVCAHLLPVSLPPPLRRLGSPTVRQVGILSLLYYCYSSDQKQERFWNNECMHLLTRNAAFLSFSSFFFPMTRTWKVERIPQPPTNYFKSVMIKIAGTR